ncbi:MAG: DUF2169 domain-containing protein [Aquabacterium sp.]|uniref:DUF2169 family type VI secretion system accessory protein n=1 Tax=Aquabacterium sp. TaxID=1872578 RepID=UPI0011FFC055|nr:DUF2169 domain-containing protein [Aquabacterium sp.]TAK99436.1 MAG: DUF2169 domain-containing protein [Aquabacterium sp.]
MQLINATRMLAGYNVGMEPSGRELLVVVIKGTFVLPQAGEAVRLHDKQVPLVMADTFTGVPGKTAAVHEVDFAPRKPMCDVLLVGSAWAPGGQAVSRMRVSLKIGPIDKQADVIGDRQWQAGLTGISATAPQAFVSMPLSYDRAFGGADVFSDDPSEHDAYTANPVGRGWHKHLKNAWVDGSPLPNIELPGEGVSFPTDSCLPVAFGPVGRGWAQRACFAGTYDQAWLDDVFPFLPRDFDERYYQAAPLDQQMPIPTGPLSVQLGGFTPDGLRSFVLPYFEAPVTVFPKQGAREACKGVLDTIVLEPDAGRFTLTWRVTRPLKKSIFEISRVQVGVQGYERWDTAPATDPALAVGSA